MDDKKQELAMLQLGSLTKKFLSWVKTLSLFQKFIMMAVLYGMYQISDLIPYAFDDMILTLGYLWYVLNQMEKIEE